MSSTSKLIGASVRAVARKRLATAQRSALILTPSALSRVKQLLNENSDAVALRVGVKTRGCNGQSYTLEYASEKCRDDDVVEQDGVKIFIDRKALMHVIGTEMDFIEEKLGSGFVFNNPNIKGTCGCGESFNV